MKTSPTKYQQQVTEVKSLQIQTADGTTIKADNNTAYVLILGAVIVACFFIYIKFGHKHVASALRRRKKK